MRTVKRRYFSKTKKEWVEKIYYYTENKNYRLTTKKGKLSKKATQSYIKSLSNGDVEKELFIKTTLRRYMYEKKVITARMINAMFNESKLDIFMSNLNISYEQIQRDLKDKDIDVDISYIMNSNHWSFIKGTTDGQLLLPDGVTVGFTFDYYEGYTINV